MPYVINVAIDDTIVVRDNSNTAITGLTSGSFATFEAYEIDTPATTATLTLTEIGSGEYRVTFTPTTADQWTVHIVYNSGGVFREWSEVYNVVLTDEVTVVVAAASTGALTQTLAQLRNRVADRLGDRVELTATANGTTTTFIDQLWVNTATEDMKGRIMVLADSGEVVRVTAMNDATYTLTFTPAAASASSTNTSSVANVFNKRGKGFRPDEYKNAINNAINDAFPLGLIEVRSTIGTAYDFESPEVTVPAAMSYVHTVEYQDDDGEWHKIMKATKYNEYGWIADATAGQIRILGGPGSVIDGLTVRLTGYGRQDVLSADSDTCALNAEWIVARACYHLTIGGIDKDDRYGQLAGVFMREADGLRTRIRTIKRPGTENVRAA